MFIKKLVSICALVALLSACGTKTLVTKVDPSQTGRPADGVLFSLPETLVVAEIPVSRVSSSPGMFSEWTEFFYPELSSNEYVTEEGTTFKLGAPTFTTRGQTDPNNVYMAHIKAGKFETKTLLLEFNDDGIIARTETSSKNESIDVITSGIKAAAAFAAPLLPFGAAAAPLGREGLTRDLADDEEYFKSKLTPRALALYNSLDQATRDKLRDNFGYQFLLYVVEATSTESNDSVGIEFFFTLNDNQWDIVEQMPHSATPCPPLPPPSTHAAVVIGRNAPPPNPGPCLAPDTLRELARALKAYNKIQELKLKRQDYLSESQPAQPPTSTLLEFRLKQIDDQIKTLEQTYFFGTTSETASTAKFEFKPTFAGMNQDLFTYSAGGRKPGFCVVSPEVSGIFKATWPKSLKGDCRESSPDFIASDFRDLKSLAKKLLAGAGANGDPVSQYLYPLLHNAGGLLNLVETSQQREQLLRALMLDLNNVVNSGASIYTGARFRNVQLSADTIKLINTPGPTPAQLNRLLIEDAYQSEIFRLSGATPLQVTLNVDTPPAGFANTVTTARLSQSGERGFPYRVPALTIARLVDNNVERGRSEVRIAQFGPVETLPASLGGRRSSYKITYYDANGAIKTFDMSADALIQQSNVTDLTDAATTLRDAETTRLKRETDILKAKKDKLDAEKALREAQEAASPSPSPSPSPQQN